MKKGLDDRPMGLLGGILLSGVSSFGITYAAGGHGQRKGCS